MDGSWARIHEWVAADAQVSIEVLEVVYADGRRRLCDPGFVVGPAANNLAQHGDLLAYASALRAAADVLERIHRDGDVA
ncbi:hypothetical protein C1I92_22815 [Jiangella anatolica]|uniref:Uncharacterized protein n=1 Tax=Jiangella anatolica TaxID=2670374 RepID=A0A2W2B7J8_9ACTN|nr:hypothetical protein C1I92_22815 [Jiangella anatolica]